MGRMITEDALEVCFILRFLDSVFVMGWGGGRGLEWGWGGSDFKQNLVCVCVCVCFP